MEFFRQPGPLTLSGGNLEAEWKLWKQKFKNYLLASGISEKPDRVQLATFLHVLGDEGLAVYNTFRFSDDEVEKLDVAMEKMEGYCLPRKNEVYERFQFWQLQQAFGESIDAFVTKLRTKAKSCRFGDQEESLIRDRIVIGCPDDRLQERLLREPDLDLLKTLSLCRAAETTREQLRTIKGDSVHLVSKALNQPVSSKNTTMSTGHSVEHRQCGNCGKAHQPRSCPAFGKTCNSCFKLNHFSICCRSSRSRQSSRKIQDERHSASRISNTVAEVEGDDEYFVGVVHIGSQTDSCWWENSRINGAIIRCKLDTGAEVNVMSSVTFNSLPNKPILTTTNVSLKAYGNQRLRTLGKIRTEIATKQSSTVAEFFVVEGNSSTILGLPTCQALNLVKRVDEAKQSPKPIESSKDLLKTFSDVFQGLGALPGEHHIVIDDTVRPVVHAPRRVPVSLEAKLKHTLADMETKGVIRKVDEPTDWVSSLLVVEKRDGTLRLCLDPRDLNRAIKREHYRIPTCEDILAKLNGKKIFTIIDMRQGFWQIKLDEESSRLCTFNTPFGRYCMRRLPFGISSAPEVFQKRSNEIFGDIEGVHVVFDDLIIAAVDGQEHDYILKKVLQRARETGVKFNESKVQLKVSEVKYLGHVISKDGVRPDPQKVCAILDMPTPTDRVGLQRFLGMVTYLSKFVPNFSALTGQLRQLLKKDVGWHWQEAHSVAFNQVKEAISKDTILQYYDRNKPCVIQTDASSDGLGSCLMQQGKPIAYASRSLTSAERNYAQIEKELLAIVFACTKFCHYIYGTSTLVLSDHKPLEAIFKKPINSTSPRLQRMLLQLLKYQVVVQYAPGKTMLVADTLSRASVTCIDDTAREISEDIDVQVHTLLREFPASDAKLNEFRRETQSDPVLAKLIQLLRVGVPGDTRDLHPEIKQYAKIWQDIYELNGILFVHGKIVVPSSLRHQMLLKLHEGHLGIEKCKGLARSCMYWPGLSRDLEIFIGKCATCNTFQREQTKEPLLPHSVPHRPWEKVAADIFQLFGRDYLLLVDYYSKYPEVYLLPNKTAESVVTALKSMFSRYGIPLEMICDNMPFNSGVMINFSREWDFTITTSSPRYPQSNGLAERNIQTVKRLLQKAEHDGSDPYLAMLQFRNAPIAGMTRSPAQLLMGRALRSRLPVAPDCMSPQAVEDRNQLLRRQQSQKHFYDRHTRRLPLLRKGEAVRIRHGGSWQKAVVLEEHPAPRSFVVKTEEGSTLRRNRRDLIKTAEPPISPETVVPEMDSSDFSETQTASQAEKQSESPDNIPATAEPCAIPVTRSGRTITRPVRFKDYIL